MEKHILCGFDDFAEDESYFYVWVKITRGNISSFMLAREIASAFRIPSELFHKIEIMNFYKVGRIFSACFRIPKVIEEERWLYACGNNIPLF